MKRCIWCRKAEGQASFNKLAHTIPQSLGGRDICKNVCDSCNAYFGCPQSGKPSIETVLKEALNVSRFRILTNDKPLKKGHAAGRFTSTYFDINFNANPVVIKLKRSFSFRPNFQEIITRQFKRGLYKVFLEETERQRGNALDDKFNFIREFARYDLNDCPVIHFERSVGMLMISNNLITHPKLYVDPSEYYLDYLSDEYSFLEFELLGHVFAIATSRLWELSIDLYIKKCSETKKYYFNGFRFVKEFDDIDLALSRCFNNNRDAKLLGIK
ncbi:HNH endonuclease [Spirosoma endophyticum]|uniref:HNH endonuclease n=1 Tax=Spirosoma endophyticum TaxID=662367 RepID=A0A1I2H7H5_9BACT|nr:HNH endonuclease [Spirosoma endophyticum]SFF24591.1 HNH endonuclease [Spirosoma endophyticum]